MQDETNDLARSLAEALGYDHPSFTAIAEMDAPLARQFVTMAQTVRATSPFTAGETALINLALNAAVVHLNADGVRAAIRAALDHGATAGEIREVLQLTSVLGIHGTIPGVLILAEAEGGQAAIEAKADPERRARAAAAAAAFTAKRGGMSPAWVTNTWFVPELVTAYAGFSGVPWQTAHLSPKFKELVYVAIDLMPQHTHLEGTRVHIAKARGHGASDSEILAILQLLALFGIQTQMLALPILQEELARHAAPQA